MIEINGLRKSFNSHEVLRGIDITLPTGETTVVMGRSGCGKSVLLKTILRLYTIDAGRIIINGIDTTEFDEKQMIPIRKRIGMLFQGSALFDSFTVEENVAYPLLENTALPMPEIRARVAEVLDFVELGGEEKKYPSELSGGMKKRVALARAIVARPDYIFFDEPTTGLDPITAQRINKLILKTEREFGTTIVVVTHELVSAFALADRFAFIHEGKIIFHGTSDEFMATDERIIKEFIREGTWKEASL